MEIRFRWAKSFSRYRRATLAAALESIGKELPQSAKWPVAFGGFSGGAKRSAVLGAMLAKTGSVRTVGFFLSGINEDRLSEAYRNYSPGRDFLEIPIWLSSGQSDNVAKPQDHDRVKASLERTGFKHVPSTTKQSGDPPQAAVSPVNACTVR